MITETATTAANETALRTCKTCGASKATTEFYFHGGYFRRACKQCETRRSQKYKRELPDDVRKERQRRCDLKKLYDITLEDYNEMLASQNGVCAICKCLNPDPERNLCVDHCHEKSRIRAILCVKCNSAIAFFRENPDYLANASEYLERTASTSDTDVFLPKLPVDIRRAKLEQHSLSA